MLLLGELKLCNKKLPLLNLAVPKRFNYHQSGFSLTVIMLFFILMTNHWDCIEREHGI